MTIIIFCCLSYKKLKINLLNVSNIMDNNGSIEVIVNEKKNPIKKKIKKKIKIKRVIKRIKNNNQNNININPLTSPGKVVTIFTYPYLSAGAPALGKAKGLIFIALMKKII